LHPVHGYHGPPILRPEIGGSSATTQSHSKIEHVLVSFIVGAKNALINGGGYADQTLRWVHVQAETGNILFPTSFVFLARFAFLYLRLAFQVVVTEKGNCWYQSHRLKRY